jgi:fucose 4-O-acetylase-like acetyltransferase
MDATKPRTANRLGMFDVLKGVGMLAIIFSHTLDYYPLGSSGGGAMPALLLAIHSDILMGAFFIMSGYGFRPRPVGKCIRQQGKALLRPYLYTALATGGLHLALHYTMFRDWHNAVVETLRVLGGFAFGLPHTATYFGVSIFSCGPMWFLVALLVGWVVLDLILNVVPERFAPLAVLAVMLAGWASARVWELPYCLSQGLIVCFYLYIGYQIKRQKWFEKPLPRWFWPAFVLCDLVIIAGALTTQSADNLSMGRWNLGPVSILAGAVVAFGITRAFARLQWPQNAPVHALEKVGRFSLLIFCLHTVELIAIPWYLFAAKFTAHPLLGLALQYGLRLALVLAGCALLANRSRIARRVRGLFAPKSARERYAPRH